MSQGVSNPAGFWIRLLGMIIDGIVIGVPLGLLLYLITGSTDRDWVIDVFYILYSLFLPIFWYGYTVGKRSVGVRIVKVDGSRLGFGAMLLRIVVSALVYGVTLGIGMIVSAFMVGLREDKRSIHDLIAGTYVTKNRP